MHLQNTHATDNTALRMITPIYRCQGTKWRLRNRTSQMRPASCTTHAVNPLQISQTSLALSNILYLAIISGVSARSIRKYPDTPVRSVSAEQTRDHDSNRRAITAAHCFPNAAPTLRPTHNVHQDSRSLCTFRARSNFRLAPARVPTATIRLRAFDYKPRRTHDTEEGG